MAIAFARLTVHTRSKGHSAVAAAAYRAGERLYDERTGETHDYRFREDVVHKEILLPENAGQVFHDREQLWKLAEGSEKRKDSQLLKELTLALPREVSQEHQIALTKSFLKYHFVDHGLVADFAIHDKGDGNPHAHCLLSLRRVEGDRFSEKKARDLNPVFYGNVQKKLYDLWHTKWRDAQNDYFRLHNIDLTVDPEYLISTKHQGRIRHPEPHYLNKHNNLVREASFIEVMRSPDVTLDYLSERHSTFTEGDIGKFLFKNTPDTTSYNLILEKVKSSPRLLELGKGPDGKIRFTTRESYRREEQMISNAKKLAGRKGKVLSFRKVQKAAVTWGLRDEQTTALLHLAQSGDISCLVGRAGTGKTYTMKALHALYKRENKRVYGAALSGIAAKTLEAETDIPSDTIYSLSKRIQEQRFCPQPGSVIVMDEAGMVGSRDMATIIDYAKTAHCKVILLGDPEQLQPILAGAPFRAIAQHIGFVEMQEIKRQIDPKDCEASHHLSEGKVGLAIDHYLQKDQWHWIDKENGMQEVIQSWERSLEKGLENQVILAHTKKQVAELNCFARETLRERKLIDEIEHILKTDYGDIRVAKGDRLLFLKNYHDDGICNGTFGTIESIQGNSFTIKTKKKVMTLDNRKIRDFTYGYAATVHKTQGVTVDRAFVYIDGFGWDKHLSYVALTRHKENLQVFANKDCYKYIDKLKRHLSRSPIRDNAIDYPLSYSIRRGFDPESVLGKVVEYLAKLGVKVRDGWGYFRKSSINNGTYYDVSYIKPNVKNSSVNHSFEKER